MESGPKLNTDTGKAPAVEHRPSFTADAPETDPKRDRLGRWPFAQRVAETIVERAAPESIVIGIYGPWGDGKTTVLNFIKLKLEEHADVVVVPFNPWLYRDEDQLQLSFLKTIAEAINEKLTTKAEALGEWLKKHHDLFSAVGIGTGGLNIAGSLAQGLGRALSSTDLSELRKRVEAALGEHKKRVVVLIDDLDRLDVAEIQTVFRLVKVAADFHYTAYLMAFDDKAVSAALAQRYPDGTGLGATFLEKIITVPLRVPSTSSDTLRGLALEGIQQVLNDQECDISKPEARRFRECFDRMADDRLTTLRIAKRFLNVIQFVVPMMKNEVNVVDLMLLEALRVLYPTAYEFIHRNLDGFMGFSLAWAGSAEEKKNARIAIDRVFDGLESRSTEAVRELLLVLFPQIQKLYLNTEDRDEESWTKHKRVASSEYCQRYFSYGVPSGDVADALVKSFWEFVRTSPEKLAADGIRQLFIKTDAGIVLSKLRRFMPRLTGPQIVGFLSAFATTGDLYAQAQGLFTGPYEQAAALAVQALYQMETASERQGAASTLVAVAQPLGFALACLEDMRSSSADDVAKRLFTSEELAPVGKALAARVASEDEKSPLLRSNSEGARRFYYVWRTWGDANSLRERLRAMIESEPGAAIDLLRLYVKPHFFERRDYDSLVETVEPEVLVGALTKLGSIDDKPSEDPEEEGRRDATIVRIFLKAHEQLTASKK